MFRNRSPAPPPAADAGAATPTIAVEDVRVGMHIHLEGGWLSHPFARSSFRVANEQQIATLRGLKLERVRWSPELSEIEDQEMPAMTAATSPPGSGAIDIVPPVKVQAPATAAERRRAAVAAEQEAQRQCERQFAEASAAWRCAGDALAADPARAGAAAGALAQSLTDKLMTDGHVGVRLLPGGGNDRAAAHALNVTVIAMLLARALGMARADLHELALGALMHDVGKFELPERVRHLEAGAGAADTQAYRDHVQRGIAAGKRMALPDGVLTVIAQHHEQADAGGFPQRLGGDRIALAARIVAIVNRYDNLCNPPTRTPPLTPHEAVAMLFAHGRTQFDASVLNAFIRMMGVYPAGSLVQLTDERYAMVVGVNSTRPLKPRVLVHEIGVPRHEALPLDLEREPDLGIRRSLTAAKVPQAALQYLDPRPRVAYFFEALVPDDTHPPPSPAGAANAAALAA